MKGYRKGQQGAILVLTAFLLPFIIAFTGMAVDFGNLYVQHQKLQNAADAAVLAGANNFTADKNDIGAAKAYADQYATQNGDINCGGSMNDASVSMDTKIDNNTKPNYYGVHMTKPVPLYFLSIFPKIGNTYNINVYASAKLNIIEDNNNDEGVLLDALMMLSNHLNIVGETGSTEFYKRNNINVTFDGKIVSTDSKSTYNRDSIVYKEEVYYDWWGFPKTIHRKVFLTSKAQAEGISVAEALSKDVNSGYWYYADHDYNYDYYSKDNPIVKTFASKKAIELTSDQVNNNQIPNIKDNEYIHVKYNSGGSNNLNLSNLNEWSSDPNKPIFIMVDPLVETKVELRNDTTRPLIIYYREMKYPEWVRRGIAQDWKGPKVTIEQNGHVFRGIVYNPQGSFHTNANGGTIKGSIVAADVDLQGAPGHYVYEGFKASGSSGGSSGSGGISQNGHVVLVSNDNIDWKE